MFTNNQTVHFYVMVLESLNYYRPRTLNDTLAVIQGSVCNITYITSRRNTRTTGLNQQVNEFGHLQYFFFINYCNPDFISLSGFLIMHVNANNIVYYFIDSDIICKKVVITEATCSQTGSDRKRLFTTQCDFFAISWHWFKKKNR